MEFMHPPDRVAPLEKLTYNLLECVGGPYLAKDVVFANSHHLVKSIVKPTWDMGLADWIGSPGFAGNPPGS